jgi:cytidine deaminase
MQTDKGSATDGLLQAALKDCAVAASTHAYSPYSHFRVGAAVTGESGKVYSGCNVENASFGLTQCAERAALTSAIAAGEPPRSLTLLVLYTSGEEPLPPCGACRQVMHELMAGDSRVVSVCDGERVLEWSAGTYLPDAFTPDTLDR